VKTLGEVLKLSIQYLESKKVARARRSVEEIIAHLLQINRVDLYMQFDRPLEEKELSLIREFLRRSAHGEPLQYIFGEVSFYHCRFEVSPDVLIPRQETEILMDKVSQELKSMDLKGKSAWDLCTGSGCLGIALKKTFPELEVALSDISPSALDIAKKNSERNRVSVSFYEGDFLAPFKGQKTDFILCNPPYVSEKEYLELEREVRDFEPERALVGGATGLEFYERLAGELAPFLFPRARIFLEIGAGQGEPVSSFFKEKIWKNKRIEKDWAGHDRFFFLEIE
jgi:release factor glutamine methyltransferase